MRERRHRIRVLLADNRTVILALLLVGSGLGLYLTYTTAISPGVTTEERQVGSWESAGEFSHRATVVNGTAVYSEGTVLQDRSAYFRTITPELAGTFTYGYTATGGGNLTVAADTDLVLRSRETDQTNGTTYWQTEDPLSTTTATGVGPDDTVSTVFSVNVTEAARRIDTIDEQFGGTPGEKQLLVVTDVRITGTRNGQPVDRLRTYRLPIVLDGSLYRVTDSGPTVESRRQTVSVTVPAEYGPVRSLGGPALLGLGLVGLGAVLAHRRYTPPVTDTERSWVQYRQVREEYDEWITRAEIPTNADEPPIVTVDTLAGLVDLAIDSDARVVKDDSRGACFVLQDTRWYRYETPAKPTVDEEPADDIAEPVEDSPSRATADETPDDVSGTGPLPADGTDDDS